MNDLTKKDYVNFLIEGVSMFFVMVVILLIWSEGDLYISHIDKFSQFFSIVILQSIVTLILVRIRKIHLRLFVVILSYALILGIFFCLISYDDKIKLDGLNLFLVFIVMVVAWVTVRYVHNQYCKNDFYFPENLSIDQKYAIVGLLAFIQGSSPAGAYSREANQIVRTMIFKLYLPQRGIDDYLNSSLNCKPEECLNRIIVPLKEIRDRDLIKRLYDRCIRIAEISGNKETKEIIDSIFSELAL